MRATYKLMVAIAVLAIATVPAGAYERADAGVEFRFDPETGRWDPGTDQSVEIQVRSLIGAVTLGGFQVDFTYDHSASGVSLAGIDTATYVSAGEMSQDYSDDVDDGEGSIFRAINLIGGHDTGVAVTGEWRTLARLDFVVSAAPEYPIEVVVDLYAAFDMDFSFFDTAWAGELPFDGGSYDGGAVCDIDGVVYEAGAPNPSNDCQFCDPEQNETDWTDRPDGQACDDGLFCTSDDSCADGECEGEATQCDDGVVCTMDTCNEETDSCVYSTDDSLCDNGLWCDGAEICNPQTGCVAGTAPTCADDGLFCNGTEFCDESSDSCVSSGNPCEDDATCDEEENICEPDRPRFCGFEDADGGLTVAGVLLGLVSLALRRSRRQGV